MDGSVEIQEEDVRGDGSSYRWQILQDLDSVPGAHVNHMVEVGGV